MHWLLNFWQLFGFFIITGILGFLIPKEWYDIFGLVGVPLVLYLTILVEKLIFKLFQK